MAARAAGATAAAEGLATQGVPPPPADAGATTAAGAAGSGAGAPSASHGDGGGGGREAAAAAAEGAVADDEDGAAKDAAGVAGERDAVDDEEEDSGDSEDELDHLKEAMRLTWRLPGRTDEATVRLTAGPDFANEDVERLMFIVGHIRLPGVAQPAGSLKIYRICRGCWPSTSSILAAAEEPTQDLADVTEALFSRLGKRAIRPALGLPPEADEGDFVFVEDVRVEAVHRGKDLGFDALATNLSVHDEACPDPYMESQPWGHATLLAGVVLSVWEPALDRSWDPQTAPELARIRRGVATVARHWERLGFAPTPAGVAADATNYHWLLRRRLNAGGFAAKAPRAPPVDDGPPPAWALAQAAAAAAAAFRNS